MSLQRQSGKTQKCFSALLLFRGSADRSGRARTECAILVRMRRGRPRHGAGDEFRLRHPAMDVGHRAKIFAPFDALAGFRDAIAADDRPALAKQLAEGGAIKVKMKV